jgi:hypothetical protein
MMEEWASLFYMSNHANLKYSLLFSPPIVPIFQHSNVPLCCLEPPSGLRLGEAVGPTLRGVVPYGTESGRRLTSNFLLFYLLPAASCPPALSPSKGCLLISDFCPLPSACLSRPSRLSRACLGERSLGERSLGAVFSPPCPP